MGGESRSRYLRKMFWLGIFQLFVMGVVYAVFIFISNGRLKWGDLLYPVPVYAISYIFVVTIIAITQYRK